MDEVQPSHDWSQVVGTEEDEGHAEEHPITAAVEDHSVHPNNNNSVSLITLIYLHFVNVIDRLL